MAAHQACHEHAVIMVDAWVEREPARGWHESPGLLIYISGDFLGYECAETGHDDTVIAHDEMLYMFCQVNHSKAKLARKEEITKFHET